MCAECYTVMARFGARSRVRLERYLRGWRCVHWFDSEWAGLYNLRLHYRGNTYWDVIPGRGYNHCRVSAAVGYYVECGARVEIRRGRRWLRRTVFRARNGCFYLRSV